MKSRGLDHRANRNESRHRVGVSKNAHGATVRRDEAENAANRGGLARAIRPKEPVYFRFVHRQIQRIEGQSVAKAPSNRVYDQCITCHCAFLRVFLRLVIYGLGHGA
jgi:hypothetical protein